MSRFWVICYDIADNHRRGRVARLLLDHVERVQESVFEGWLSAAQQRDLEQRLAPLIEASEDSIRFYPLLLREAICRQSAGTMPALRREQDFWIV